MSRPEFSACLEWLFAEPGDAFEDRIAGAASAGFDAFEFWLWSNKDVAAIEESAKAHGIAVAGLVAEPLIPLTDPQNRSAFLEGLRQSVDVVRRLKAPVLIAQAGSLFADRPRDAQKQSLIDTLGEAADILGGSGVTLGLEPLNSRVDHPGYFLDSTREGFEILDTVNRPEIGMVYDLYHAAVMEEPFAETLAGHIDRIVHVHVADHPGRHEPGSGGVDLIDRLHWLIGEGYTGRIGFEFKPRNPDGEALRAMREMFAEKLA